VIILKKQKLIKKQLKIRVGIFNHKIMNKVIYYHILSKIHLIYRLISLRIFKMNTKE
jgi:hypothetical protein